MRNCYYKETIASMKLLITDKFGGENKQELRRCLNDLLSIQKREIKGKITQIFKES